MSVSQAAERICVFCGSRDGANPRHVETASELGRELAERGIGVVYGGARVGLMGALAEGALAAGGEVVGVIPRSLLVRELAHEGLSDLRIVGSMHERKATMAELSDAFVALPGGIGTLEELFEVWTWAHLGIHNKPIGLANIEGFFDQLLAFADALVEEGFLAAASRDLVISEPELSTLTERLRAAMATTPPAPPSAIEP